MSAVWAKVIIVVHRKSLPGRSSGHRGFRACDRKFRVFPPSGQVSGGLPRFLSDSPDLIRWGARCHESQDADPEWFSHAFTGKRVGIEGI